MAAKSLPEQAKALVGKLLAALPFLKRRLPVGGKAAEPFDTIEDEASGGLDDFGPNAAPDVPRASHKAGKAGTGGNDRSEALKSFFEAVLHNKLALILIFASFFLILAICIAAIIATAPPAASSATGRASPEGIAVLRRVIKPSVPGIEARVELERETDKVYTAEDAKPFLTDPASVDTSRLESRNAAEIESLYRTVP